MLIFVLQAHPQWWELERGEVSVGTGQAPQKASRHCPALQCGELGWRQEGWESASQSRSAPPGVLGARAGPEMASAPPGQLRVLLLRRLSLQGQVAVGPPGHKTNIGSFQYFRN